MQNLNRLVDTWKRRKSLTCNRNMCCKRHPGMKFLIVCLFYKLPKLDDLKGCSWHGWVMDHLRWSGTIVCQDQFTRNPGTEKMQCPHKALQQETRNLVACEPQIKVCLLLFIGMMAFFSFSLLSVHEWSVQGVLCKSRTWHYAQEGVDNVMSLSVQEKIWIREWGKNCPPIFAEWGVFLSQQNLLFVLFTLIYLCIHLQKNTGIIEFISINKTDLHRCLRIITLEVCNVIRWRVLKACTCQKLIIFRNRGNITPQN